MSPSRIYHVLKHGSLRIFFMLKVYVHWISVENDEFVQENVKFSNQAKTFGQAFSDFSPLSKKGATEGPVLLFLPFKSFWLCPVRFLLTIQFKLLLLIWWNNSWTLNRCWFIFYSKGALRSCCRYWSRNKRCGLRHCLKSWYVIKVSKSMFCFFFFVIVSPTIDRCN